MKITIISAVFPPEPVVSAKTSASLAAALTRLSQRVSVITNFPNRPAGTLYPGYRRAFFDAQDDPKGFRLVRCFSFFSRESSLPSRWLENISFGLSSGLALLFSRRPDAVYSNSWPLFATGLACLACRVRRVPLVLHVQDLYPESLAMQGRLKEGGWLYRLLLGFDRWIAGQAAALIVLSERFAGGYTQLRRVPASRVHVIPDWVEAASVVGMEKAAYRQAAGISATAFVLVYGGNVGVAAGVETVIAAMRSVKTGRETVLVVAGSGSQLAACRKLAQGMDGLPDARVRFHSPWAAEETSQVLAAADVLVLPTRGTQSLASIPSKLLAYLLAARPVLALVLPESDTAGVIAAAGCGWVVAPDDPERLAGKIAELAGLSDNQLGQMGAAGREYALQHFSAETCLPKVIEVIQNATSEAAR